MEVGYISIPVIWGSYTRSFKSTISYNPHLDLKNHGIWQVVVKCKNVRLRAQTHFIVGVFSEHRAGEMTFSRGAENRIHHLRPFGILVIRPVPKLEESHSRGVSLAASIAILVSRITMFSTVRHLPIRQAQQRCIFSRTYSFNRATDL